MQKLLIKYAADPCEKNVAAIKNHIEKNPMSALQLTPEQSRKFK